MSYRLNSMHCQMSQLIFSFLRDTKDETTSDCTCENDIIAKLQITGMSRYCRSSSMQNWDSFSSSAARKTVMGLEHKGGVNHLVLTRRRSALLSAYFYHPFHHKVGNYAHFSTQPQLPEDQFMELEVYQKLSAAAVQGRPLERWVGIQTR